MPGKSKSTRKPKPAPDRSVRALRELIDFEFGKLGEVLAVFSRAESVSQHVIGEWTVKDVLAHLTAWERRLIQRVSGLPEDGAGMGTPQFNAQVYQRNRARSWRAVKKDYDTIHGQVIELVDALSDADAVRWWTAFRFNTFNHYKWARTELAHSGA